MCWWAAQVLAPAAREININEKIMALYLDHLVPGITQPGDDNNYGSAAVYDVLALQVCRLTSTVSCCCVKSRPRPLAPESLPLKSFQAQKVLPGRDEGFALNFKV